MIYFVLDDLCSPTGIFAVLLLKICVQIVYFNFFISRAWSYSIQRKAAFLRLKSPGFLCDHRIDHCKLKWSCCHYNNIFAHSNCFRIIKINNETPPTAQKNTFLRKNGIEEKTEEEHLNAETQEEEDSKLVYEIEQNEWRLLSSDFESRGEFLVLIEQDIYDFGIDTQKFPRADSFLNRLLGVEGRNLPRS